MSRHFVPPAKRTSARVMAAKLAKIPAVQQDPALRASDHDDFLIDFGTTCYRVSVETYHSTVKPWLAKREAARVSAVKMIEPDDPAPALHPATAELVDRFAIALKEKLLASQIKHTERAVDAWTNPHWRWLCQSDLVDHVRKGDPLDVAAYAAFCWHHGWLTSAHAYALDLPREAPFTCGTAHVAAQATLKLADPALRIGNADFATLDLLQDLVNAAGVRFAAGVLTGDDPDVPF